MSFPENVTSFLCGLSDKVDRVVQSKRLQESKPKSLVVTNWHLSSIYQKKKTDTKIIKGRGFHLDLLTLRQRASAKVQLEWWARIWRIFIYVYLGTYLWSNSTPTIKILRTNFIAGGHWFSSWRRIDMLWIELDFLVHWSQLGGALIPYFTIYYHPQPSREDFYQFDDWILIDRNKFDEFFL